MPHLLIAPSLSEYRTVRASVANRLADGSVQVVQCGIGPARATPLCRHLENSGWTGTMALIGWAGGLCSDLRAGDLVLADAAVEIHGGRVLLEPNALPCARVGALLCVSAPLLTQRAKSAVQDHGALAVEMEAYPLAAWAAAHEVPFLHARVILDAVHETLPDLGDALDVWGRVHFIRLARRLLSRPELMLNFVTLARRVRELDPHLAALARAVAALWQESDRASR
jgi:nucleoside phosphorylase